MENWFSDTFQGFLAARDQERAQTAAHWARAWDRTRSGDLRDTPLHAVACTNLAAAGAPGAAQAADAAWRAVAAQAEGENLPLPARSSVFHLMLASRHAAPFSAYLRNRALMLARLGAELAQANAAPEATGLPLYDDSDADTALPDFLLRAVRAHRAGCLGRADALASLNRQIDHLRAYGGALPRGFRAQMDACLGFCAFAPLLAGLERDGAPLIIRRSGP